jgi:hypothetical protein
MMSVPNVAWYHGGDLKGGKPTGTYLYVTERQGFAKEHAELHPNGRVYRLRPEYHPLVTEHPCESDQKVIRQADLLENGGALAVFEEV